MVVMLGNNPAKYSGLPFLLQCNYGQHKSVLGVESPFYKLFYELISIYGSREKKFVLGNNVEITIEGPAVGRLENLV